jgi:hypothetical protein
MHSVAEPSYGYTGMDREIARLDLPRVLGRSIRTTAVGRVCRFYFPLIHLVFSAPLASEKFPHILGGEKGLKIWPYVR